MNAAEPNEDFVQYTPKLDYFTEPTDALCPVGLRTFQPQLPPDTEVIGLGEIAPENTTDIAFMFRPAPGAPFECPRSCRPGEIGWGIPKLTDCYPLPLSRPERETVLREFKQITDDFSSQHPAGIWRPGPKECPPLTGCYRENIYSCKPDLQLIHPTFATSTNDQSQGVTQDPPLHNQGRFRPLEATQHLGIHRHC